MYHVFFQSGQDGKETISLLRAFRIDTDDQSGHIVCEGAKKLIITRSGRHCRAVYAEEEKKYFLEEVRFSVDPTDGYFRVTVFDENGLTADTNAYFVDTLGLDFGREMFRE